MNDSCFQLKGSVLTTLILDLHEFEEPLFKQQLSDKIETAREFFAGSPVILNLTSINRKLKKQDIDSLIASCRQSGLLPIGFKTADNTLQTIIEQHGLSILSESGKTGELKTAEKNTPSCKPALIIERTVRSGQQVYAEGRDLIILGSVSGGAEVLADGNIHIYGNLRGRALAGVQGNTEARVFCTHNEAELVSIAGHFLISDSIEERSWKTPCQFRLVDEALHVNELS